MQIGAFLSLALFDALGISREVSGGAQSKSVQSRTP